MGKEEEALSRQEVGMMSAPVGFFAHQDGVAGLQVLEMRSQRPIGDL